MSRHILGQLSFQADIFKMVTIALGVNLSTEVSDLLTAGRSQPSTDPLHDKKINYKVTLNLTVHEDSLGKSLEHLAESK